MFDCMEVRSRVNWKSRRLVIAITIKIKMVREEVRILSSFPLTFQFDFAYFLFFPCYERSQSVKVKEFAKWLADVVISVLYWMISALIKGISLIRMSTN